MRVFTETPFTTAQTWHLPRLIISRLMDKCWTPDIIWFHGEGAIKPWKDKEET